MRKWMAGVLLGVACCGMAAAQEIPNPLKRALRGLFGKPQVQEEEELTHRNRRTEDRRAPYSVEQAELFERGDQRWKQGDYGGAFPIFQQVLEGGEDCLVPVGVGQKVVWRSVRDEIEERLRGAGGEVIDTGLRSCFAVLKRVSIEELTANAGGVGQDAEQ